MKRDGNANASAVAHRDGNRCTCRSGLQIAGLQPGIPGDPGEHPGADFLTVVKGKNVIRSSDTRQNAMRAA